MPKYTDLPLSTSVKANDIVCFADPDANESKRIELGVLKQELIKVSFLSGTVAPLVLPVNGGAIQILNTFSNSGGNYVDPVAGTIGVPASGTFNAQLAIIGNSLFSGNTVEIWNNLLFMRVDDGVGGVTNMKIGSFSTFVKNGLVEWQLSTAFIVQLVGSPTTEISFGVAVNADKNADTYIIESTSLFLEQVA